MSAELIEINPQNPDQRTIKRVAQSIREGAIMIYPSDTLYGLGCDITNKQAIERICRIKQIKPEKANFSFICRDFSTISSFTKPISNSNYKLLRKNLPGPFTFIFQASNSLPKLMKNRKKTVGIRIPDSEMIDNLLSHLDYPILSTSITNVDDEYTPYPTDPYEIYETYKHQVDIVLDGGFGKNIPSTVIDLTDGEADIIREGLGQLIY